MVLVKTWNLASRWLIERTRKVFQAFLNSTNRKSSSHSRESPTTVIISEKGVLLLLLAFPQGLDSIPGETRGILKDDWDPSRGRKEEGHGYGQKEQSLGPWIEKLGKSLFSSL